MHIATIDSAGDKVALLKKALLPVLGLCGKNNDCPAHAGALLIDVIDNDVVFQVTDGRYAFISKVQADTLNGESFSGTLRSSNFGMLPEIIKKTKAKLSIAINLDEESETFELLVTTEIVTVSARDSADLKHPDLKRYLASLEGDTERVITPGRVLFNPSVCLPVLNAFKGTVGMSFDYHVQNRILHITTTPAEPFVRFEAVVAGLEPPK